jgi:hypothetical protein
MERHDIVLAARSFLNVRWRHRGRDRTGMDCIGLLLATGREVGLDLQDTDLQYRRLPDFALFKDMIRSQSRLGSVNDIRHGSILMLNQGAVPCHCGIACLDGPPTVIHAALMRRKVVEEPLPMHFGNLVEVREFNGVW